MLGGSNSSSCPRDPPRIRGLEKLVGEIKTFAVFQVSLISGNNTTFVKFDSVLCGRIFDNKSYHFIRGMSPKQQRVAGSIFPV